MRPLLSLPLLLLLLLVQCSMRWWLLPLQRSMRVWPRSLWRRRRLASRQPAQDLVEFGLIVAAVSILGIAGLNVLGRAEEGYFIPLASTLAPQAPVVTDDVVHPTTEQIHCMPTSVVATVPSNLSCSFTVADAWNV